MDSKKLTHAILGALVLSALVAPGAVAASENGARVSPAASGAAATIAAALGDELVPGGTFDSGYAPWFVTEDLRADASTGALCSPIAGGTANPWSSIFGVDNVPIVKGKHYDLSFTAVAETPTPVVIRALVQQPAPPWNATYEANPSIGGADTEFSYTFTSTMDLPAAQLVFQVGAADADWSLCLDNVSIVEGDAPEAFVPETGPLVRVNQLGYLTTGPKRATLETESADPLDWQLIDANGDVEASGRTEPRGEDATAGAAVHIIDFGSVNTPGEGYRLEADGESSHPFAIGDDLYTDLRTQALNYFYFARSGIEILDSEGYEGYARAAGHIDVAPNQGDGAVGCQKPEPFMQSWTCDYQLDVTGGWYDAGDHGKYVVNGGIAVHQVLSTWERAVRVGSESALADSTLAGPEKGNGVPDILDEARWELEWMLSMQVPADKPLAGMAHHKVQDNEWTGLPLLPSDDPKPRQLHRPSTAATLNLAAVAAQGSRIFAEIDPEFSATLLEAARTAWVAAVQNPKLYAPLADGSNGGGPYNDDDVTDEFYWAAAELYLTTGEKEFETSLTESPHHTGDIFFVGGFDWGRTAALGRMQLAMVDSDLADRDAVRSSIVDLADRYVKAQSSENYGQPFAPRSGYTWGSNSSILNNQVVIATAFDITGDGAYRNSVLEAMDYLLGRNALGQSYITGYGTVFSKNQHSRWFANQLNPNLPNPPIGSVAGGPNSALQDPIAQQVFSQGCVPQQCYLDEINSYSTNEITVNWNSAMSWVASFAADQGDGDGAAGGSDDSDVPNVIALILASALIAVGVGLIVTWFEVRRRKKAAAAASADAASAGAGAASAEKGAKP